MEEQTRSESSVILQNSEHAPAQPTYVLRGHSAQIHSVHFYHGNLRLISADADGWVVVWDVAIKRPASVWKAHNNAVLAVGTWDDDKIITHGRDNKLHVWHFRREDEANLSTLLPINDPTTERKAPWLLHSLTVHALNFCSFAMCHQTSPSASPPGADDATNTRTNAILIAVPSVHDGHINVTALPSEDRVATIPTPKGIANTGMLMAIGLHHHKEDLLVIAGYESGHACVWRRTGLQQHWQAVYTHQAHSQPILALDVAPRLGCFFTSSADAVVARHPLLQPPEDMSGGTKLVQTKHAGQQSLTVRSDERIFATAGWDGRVRVYSAASMKELAVLKWHREGCYAVAFADCSNHDLLESNNLRDAHESGRAIVKRNLTVSELRVEKTKSTHWLAAGSKDGKVSLWDIY